MPQVNAPDREKRRRVAEAHTMFQHNFHEAKSADRSIQEPTIKISMSTADCTTTRMQVRQTSSARKTSGSAAMDKRFVLCDVSHLAHPSP